jgi:hypothetical protein
VIIGEQISFARMLLALHPGRIGASVNLSIIAHSCNSRPMLICRAKIGLNSNVSLLGAPPVPRPKCADLARPDHPSGRASLLSAHRAGRRHKTTLTCLGR